MKIISKYYYMLLLLGVVLMTSCSDDFLDTKPQDKTYDEAVWNNKNMIDGFILDTYNSIIPKLAMNPGDGANKGANVDNWTDNVALQFNERIGSDKADRFWDDPKDLGWDQFSSIRKCNMILTKVNKSKALMDADKKEFLAEGHMLRALIYYRQARLYGKYVKIEKVLKPGDELKLPRTKTIKETYDFILNDLKLAAKDLPVDADAGRLTKGAAYAFTAEIALQGAAYVETGQADYYQISRKASEDLFALNKYSLDDDYLGLTSYYDHAITSSEMILGWFLYPDVTTCAKTRLMRLLTYLTNGRVKNGCGPSFNTSVLGWESVWPSNDLVKDYLIKDAVTGEALKWDETSQFTNIIKVSNDHKEGSIKPNINKTVNDIIYLNRDKRFYATVLYDSCKFFNNLITIKIGGNKHYNSDVRPFSTPAVSRSGYYFIKGINEKVSPEGIAKNYTGYHYNIMRLGRAYLNYAEVMLRLNQPNKAIEYINKTREHHGGLPALSAGLLIAEVWKYYKIERRVELVLENDRYWSLLRWGKTDGSDGVDKTIPEMNHDCTWFEIAEDRKSFSEIPLPANADINQRHFTKRRYLFPVPQGKIQANPKLDQNPGW